MTDTTQAMRDLAEKSRVHCSKIRQADGIYQRHYGATEENLLAFYRAALSRPCAPPAEREAGFPDNYAGPELLKHKQERFPWNHPGRGEIVRSGVVSHATEPTPDFEAMQRAITSADVVRVPTLQLCTICGLTVDTQYVAVKPEKP